ncbi:MAG: SpoIIE family protein phosphatase, partial [Oscillospiraceae bacterium]|nr:SpoIIE family protein phosphatase [Oscillospiraceae bacterium]
ADVSGKGIPAAMFMMISKTLIKSAAQSGLSPKAVLEKVNNQLCENNDAEMFVTVWIGIMQISTGKTVCANAGHEYPAIMRANGEFELFKDRHGFVLAGMEGARYREYELELNPGDRLFVYTDGVAEATNAQNELFGTDRMIDALNKYKDGTCSDILHGVKAEIDGFVLEAPQFDDITMLCLTLTPPADDGRITMTMEPSLENIEKATAFLREGLESAEAPKRVISQVSIVIDEILSNVANYSGATEASVSYTTDERKISMQFVDNGNPYDPTSAPEPDITLAAEDREIGGLGIFIVKKTMDTVSYINEGGKNILTIEKSW